MNLTSNIFDVFDRIVVYDGKQANPTQFSVFGKQKALNKVYFKTNQWSKEEKESTPLGALNTIVYLCKNLNHPTVRGEIYESRNDGGRRRIYRVLVSGKQDFLNSLGEEAKILYKALEEKNKGHSNVVSLVNKSIYLNRITPELRSYFNSKQNKPRQVKQQVKKQPQTKAPVKKIVKKQPSTKLKPKKTGQQKLRFF